MKPTKNQFYCPGCKHPKMLFASKKEASLFLKFNADAIEQETGRKPVRAYYCSYCCGWHLTSRPNSYSRKDLINRFGYEVGMKFYNKIHPLIAKGTSLTKGLYLRLKELSHNLRYDSINTAKCRWIINDLFEIFEIVIRAQLEDKSTIDTLFKKFSQLCTVYSDKQQTMQIS